MFQELKMLSLKKNLLKIIIFFAIGCGVFAIQFSAVKTLFGGKKDLDELTADQIHDSMYVEATVWGIYDWYANTTETSNSVTKKVSQEYIIPVGEEEYMGMLVKPEYFDRCDALIEESWQYLDGEISEITGQFRVKGTILSMDDESWKYFRKVLGYDDWSPEERELALPYYLVVDQFGDSDTVGLVICVILGLVIWGITLWLLIASLSGSFQKSLKKYCKEGGAQSRVEQFYQSTTPVRGLRVSRDYILGMAEDSSSTFLMSDSLLWAYTYIQKTKQGFITVSRNVSVKFATKDGNQYYHSVKNEDQAGEVLEHIHKVLPWAVVGYSDELDRVYRNDRQSMISAVEERRAQENNTYTEM